MHKAVSLFMLAAATIIAAWWWLGRAVPMPPSPLDTAEKLHCVSYAPFQGRQSPLDLSTRIEPVQIDDDLKRLSAITGCVRIYSVDFGLENVPEIARRHGLKVLLGAWVSGHRDRTEHQIRTTIALAKRFPGTVDAIIVGNEALLRGEIAPDALAALIAEVKSQVAVPVTYADVWEFWVRHRQVADAVDFVTVHILPYWEDHPVAANQAADHVAAIRRQVAAVFPGREILIGEVGWPSAGRMRAGALPSPANQALVLHDILERGKREDFRVNVIEAFDQPWKRYQEGTAGGHWGLITDPPRTNKFAWGAPVSNHPFWPWQAAFGVLFAAAVFAAPRAVGREATTLPDRSWLAIAVIATVSGVAVGWTLAAMPLESLGAAGWARSIALAILALAAPIACAIALVRALTLPAFAAAIGSSTARSREPLERWLGFLLVTLFVLAMETALGLSFDPRYRDFPFAPLTSAAVPFLLLAFMSPRQASRRPVAETAGAAVLTVAAAFVVFNEGISNWQSVWTGCALAAVAVTLARVRAAPG